MCSDISDLSGGMREGSPGEIVTRGSSCEKWQRQWREEARRRAGKRGTGLARPPEGCDFIINITIYFWRERHLSHPLFLSAHPCSLPLIYLSKSLIFCISEEDVNGKEFPLSARAPRGGDAQEGSPSGARDEGCWCQKERMIDEKQTPGYRHSSFCFRY
uniref:Uncharacterized protein LOC112824306 n=1 Tax=Callorhinus ursinus TaxID=34884 RepID=A0A3Q7P2D8_CALUR|nr:uncharacterized protein LOC112824306 [Callorhinus ursinus]